MTFPTLNYIVGEGAEYGQQIRSQGITEKLLRLRYIEALERMGSSNSSKLIITDGTKPPTLTQPVVKPSK